LRSMTEETRLIKRFEPFYLGICKCGCNQEIKILRDEWRKTLRKYNNKHKPRGKDHYNWKGGKKIQKGYSLMYHPNHPSHDKNGYIMEHRYVMEQHLGRYLIKQEDIHHINKVKTDNRIENLMLFPNRSAHRKYELSHPI
jgi:hypothetical protein